MPVIPNKLPVLYYHGVTRFGHRVSESAPNQIKEFLASYQPGPDDKDGLLAVEKCIEMFTTIEEVLQKGIRYAGPG